MRKMKYDRLKAAVMLVIICMFTLCGCSGKTIKGTDGMLAYMCSNHGEGIEYSGSVSDAGETLAWFSFDRSNPTCLYMVFKNKGNDEYEPQYDPNRTMNAGVCCCPWHGGVVVHIENEDIKELQIVSGKAETYSVAEYPFNVFSEISEGETYIFCIDKDGNIIESL